MGAVAMKVTEEDYQDIVVLYGHADSLASTVESASLKERRAQYKLISPLVEEIELASDTLTEEYMQIAEQGQKPGKSAKTKIEGALRRLFVAIDQYTLRAEEAKATLSEKSLAATGKLVAGLRRQAERITAIFLNFVALSVDRIMHRKEVEEMKKHEAHIATTLHNLSKS